MGKHDKLLIKILRGTSDANIQFSGLCNLLKVFGFDERTRGDHHIFTRNDIEVTTDRLEVQTLSGETNSEHHIKIQIKFGSRR